MAVDGIATSEETITDIPQLCKRVLLISEILEDVLPVIHNDVLHCHLVRALTGHLTVG